MSDFVNVDGVVAKLSKEHKIINDYVGKFAQDKKEKKPGFFDSLKNFVAMLERDLKKHFQMEEMVFFPAAMQGANDYNTALTVLSLQKDHGALENQLEAAVLIMDDPLKINDEKIDVLDTFFNYLKIHTNRELTDLFPLIEQDIKCKTLLMKHIGEKRADL
jgi:iron-sulfur cluster repair protein YtfE (RIC family)